MRLSLLSLATTLSLCILAFGNTVNAQIFVTSDTTANGTVASQNVFVGKNNRDEFFTMPGTITYTIGNGSNVPGSFLETVIPSRGRYKGINVFGFHRLNMTGGAAGQYDSGVYGYDSSTINISGGNVYTREPLAKIKRQGANRCRPANLRNEHRTKSICQCHF